MDKKLYQKLNAQVNHELYAGYLYLSMAAKFEEKSLSGFAHWMREQFIEEQEHAMKIFNYLVSRGETIELDAIQKPEAEWDTPIEAFQLALEHEKLVTSQISDIMAHAIKVKDYPTVQLMNWYVEEQVEEEANVNHVIDQLAYAGEDKSAILMLDRHLGERQEAR